VIFKVNLYKMAWRTSTNSLLY